METAREDIIKVTHLNKQFLVNKQPMEVLHDINLQVKKRRIYYHCGAQWMRKKHTVENYLRTC